MFKAVIEHVQEPKPCGRSEAFDHFMMDVIQARGFAVFEERYGNGTETLALNELQQQRLQVCENNWVRKIARVTRADRRRMVELREETGVQRSLTERLVRSRLQWAGHVERMADDRLPKRAAELREQGRRRRGRPRLRWEDCVKRAVKKAGEEGDWKKKKTQDRVVWKRLAYEAVKKLQASPHP